MFLVSAQAFPDEVRVDIHSEDTVVAVFRNPEDTEQIIIEVYNKKHKYGRSISLGYDNFQIKWD